MNAFNLLDDSNPTQKEFVSYYNNFSNSRVVLIPVPFIFFNAAFWILDKLLEKAMKKKISLVYRLKSIEFTPVFSTQNSEQKLSWKPNKDVEKKISDWVGFHN